MAELTLEDVRQIAQEVFQEQQRDLFNLETKRILSPVGA